MTNKQILSSYAQLMSTKKVAAQIGISQSKVRKMLYDAGALPLPVGGERARELYAKGHDTNTISKMLKRSHSWVHMMIPKQGRPHNKWEPEQEAAVEAGHVPAGRSINAVRIKRCRLRKQQRDERNCNKKVGRDEHC